MPLQVCNNAMIQCTFGSVPTPLMVTPEKLVFTTASAANIMDHIPFKNINTFGMCTSQANPAVALATSAATTAAGGVYTPTPAPCVPATPNPWVSGATTVLIDKFPALDDTATLSCVWFGLITVVSPGQSTVLIP